ncbi:AcrR family transcriptional regulator [Microbacterium halimionae]|uniref:AcrR family transcriptional regulator n=1 Tax=Microbacterium halimionae TaxID=1526413 RepID=A0A7W3JMN7_9MICO|nr:TetR/AcrR family transcriptional regulator [Microbacterium halimionae]MBA8815569.1 AcrR family transcriptional regulator [Microbacterium halimionae]NII95615.1 AcrR family transcriptional regulator [Microbacterium halimionae]
MAEAVRRRTRGPYAKSAATRERILDACEAVLGEAGYHAATVRDIADRAGISERGLVHHFPGRDELLRAVLERHEEQARVASTPAPGLEALLHLVERVAQDSRTPGIVELHTTLSAEASSVHHPAHEHYVERYDQIRRYATSSFVALDAAGEIDSTLTPDELAAAYVAMSDGLQLQWLYRPGAVDPADTLQRFLQSVVPRLREGHPSFVVAGNVPSSG